MILKSAAFSHTGMRRLQNQDSFLNRPDLGLFIVADGMGGHRGGEIASGLAIQTIQEFFEKNSAKKDTLESAMQKIEDSLLLANEAIQKRGDIEPDLKGMGTTASVLYFTDQYAILGQVGDSRMYLIQNQKIWQLTKDHSLVQEKLRAGLITRQQVKTDKNRNVITRSVGYETNLNPDLFWFQTKPDDVFVVCSDGLHGLVEDPELLSMIIQHVMNENDLEKASRELIQKANEYGGDDNVTTVIVKVER